MLEDQGLTVVFGTVKCNDWDQISLPSIGVGPLGPPIDLNRVKRIEGKSLQRVIVGEIND